MPLHTLLSITQVKTLWERLLARFMFVEATFLFAAPYKQIYKQNKMQDSWSELWNETLDS